MKTRKITRRNATNFGLGAAADEWDGLLTAMRKKGYGDGELLASGLAIRGKNGGLYDKFRKRLIFPIIDVRGDVLGFGGRIISKDDPGAKYKMCIRDSIKAVMRIALVKAHAGQDLGNRHPKNIRKCKQRCPHVLTKQAVSYTHLDVYKRQQHSGSKKACSVHGV